VGLEIVSNLIHNSFGLLNSSYFSFVSYKQHLGIKYVNSQESPILGSNPNLLAIPQRKEDILELQYSEGSPHGGHRTTYAIKVIHSLSFEAQELNILLLLYMPDSIMMILLTTNLEFVLDGTLKKQKEKIHRGKLEVDKHRGKGSGLS